MTSKEKLEAIISICESQLPGLLSAATLANFAEYLTRRPKKADDLEFCGYLSEEGNSTNQAYFSVLLQVQLYKVQTVQDYHSVIFQFLEENIIPSVVGMGYRDSIAADLYEPDKMGSAFIYYQIDFRSELDDCDF